MALQRKKGHFHVVEAIAATLETKHPEYVQVTQQVFNDVVMFYVEVMRLDVEQCVSTPGKNLYVTYESLTIPNKDRHEVPYPIIYSGFPATLRRAAIKKAHGLVKSYDSNFKRWQSRIEKASHAKTPKARARRKKKVGKPPVLPTSTNFPAQMYSGMFKEDTGETIMVKLWTGKAWVWEKVEYKARELPEGYSKGTCSLLYSEHGLKLIWVIEKLTPSKGKLADHIQATGKLRILSIDLNLDDPIVVGKVLEGSEDNGAVEKLATFRLRGNNRLNHLRKRLLGKIAVAKSKTNTHTELGVDPPDDMCRNLWGAIRRLEKDMVEQMSHQIVEFAEKWDCRVIVFENLKSLRPISGKYSRRSNTKRAWWVAKKIQKRVETKALNRYSIYTARVNPAYTSITDAQLGGECLRGDQVGALSLYLFKRKGLGKFVQSPEGRIMDSGDNAASNIGLRYLAAKFQKPVLFGIGLSLGTPSWLTLLNDKGNVVVVPSWYALRYRTKEVSASHPSSVSA